MWYHACEITTLGNIKNGLGRCIALKTACYIIALAINVAQPQGHLRFIVALRLLETLAHYVLLAWRTSLL
jgi:hypothetical protein